MTTFDWSKVILLSGFALANDLLIVNLTSRYGIANVKNWWRRSLMTHLGIRESLPWQILLSQLLYYGPIIIMSHQFRGSLILEYYWWYVILFPACCTLLCTKEFLRVERVERKEMLIFHAKKDRGVVKVLRRPWELQMTAVHEAAHAVLSCHLRCPFAWVTIIPHEDSVGHLAAYRLDEMRLTQAARNAPVRMEIENRVMLLFSGGIAERRAGMEYRSPESDTQDFADAKELLANLTSGERELHYYQCYLHDRAKGLIENGPIWKAIEKVAEALVEEEILTERKVKKIYRRTINRSFLETLCLKSFTKDREVKMKQD